jgi:DNA-binding SARP family transcriptional activator/type II secretory pathway predicted ATPase ExeA
LAQLELVCFGPPTARLAGREPPPDVVWRKHLGLLIYLAFSPDRTRARDHLLGLLWPEKPEAHARHSLNEAVRRLRARLGAERLLTRGDAITLHDAGLSVDALRFAALPPERSAEAVALLRGDFLEGFTVDDAPAFEEWTAHERTRWRTRGAGTLVTAGEAALAAGRLADAEEVALRALALEPHGEAGARLRLRTMALRGDTAGALAWYHEYAGRLETTLGERPSRDLEALVERIRNRAWHRVPTPPAVATPPLVGREAAQRTALRVIGAALAGASRTLVVIGDPGLGKTRLLGETLARAALDGAVTVVATPLASDHDAPWSTLRALGRAGLVTAPGSAATDPEALTVLGGLLPEFGSRPSRVPTDHGEVANALARLLATVVEERPLVVAVDDAHYADGATLAALGAALAEVRAGPLALVLTCLPDAGRGPPALTHLRSEVGRRLSGESVRLEPLAPADVRRLVEALAPWCTDEEMRERLARRTMFETTGSPFLAVTLLHALARASTMRSDVLAWPHRGSTIDSPLPISVPDLVRMAVVARVSELDPDDLQLLRAASIGGLGLDLELLSETSGLAGPVLDEGLTRLERAGLVTCDGRRYSFAAPLIAEVVRRDCLTPGQRRALRRRAADRLAAREDTESRLLRVELLSELEPDGTVLDLALAAADDALATDALRSAHRALAAAERVVKEGGGGEAERTRIAALRDAIVGR